MIPRNLQQALDQVHEIQRHLVDRQRFRGFSGPARIASGLAALAAAGVMSLPRFPQEIRWHFVGWGAVFGLAFLLNFVSLLLWFLRDPEVARSFRRLRPVADVAPPLFVGALLSVVLAWHGQADLLFGLWMCLLGLAHFATRYVLPRTISLVGLFYVVAGAFCLVAPGIRFLNPWPMALAFAGGETASGLLLLVDQTRYQAVMQAIREEDRP